MTEAERICWDTCAYHLTLQWGKFSKWLHTFPVYVQCTKQKFKIVSIAWVTFVYQPLEDVVHWLFMHYQVMDLEAGKVMIHAQVFGSWLVCIMSYWLVAYTMSYCYCIICLPATRRCGSLIVHALSSHGFGSRESYGTCTSFWFMISMYYVILLLHYSYSMPACFITQTLQLRIQSGTI